MAKYPTRKLNLLSMGVDGVNISNCYQSVQLFDDIYS